MRFHIDTEIDCDETYVFPDDQLLIKSRLGQMQPVKHIFRLNAKSEVLTLDFSPDKLGFKGQINKKFGYELQANTFDNLGVYVPG